MPKEPDAAVRAEGEATPRRSLRKRKSRKEEAGGRSTHCHTNQRIWSDDDAIALLKGVIDFRAKTGITPTASNIGSFFDFIKGSLSLPPHITQEKVYYKIRRLKRKYHHTYAHGPHDGPLYHLSVQAWAATEDQNEDAKTKDDAGGEGQEAGGGAAAALYPYLTNALSEYWKANGLSEELLQRGLQLIHGSKAKALDLKWRRHYDADLELRAKQYELSRDLFMELAAAHKGKTS